MSHNLLTVISLIKPAQKAELNLSMTATRLIILLLTTLSDFDRAHHQGAKGEQASSGSTSGLLVFYDAKFNLIQSWSQQSGKRRKWLRSTLMPPRNMNDVKRDEIRVKDFQQFVGNDDQSVEKLKNLEFMKKCNDVVQY